MSESKINNQIYDTMGQRWFEAEDDPIALLRAEAPVKNDWVHQQIRRHFDQKPEALQILDVGCGAGFLTNPLSLLGYRVTGLDASADSLKMAGARDESRQVDYCLGRAEELPYSNESFDVITCMDFLEHVEDPQTVIRECARVLRPGGLFFFHTFNRNLLSWLIVIKGVEWFVKNTPKNLHVYSLFIRPQELQQYCTKASLQVQSMTGIRPKMNRAFFDMLGSGRVNKDFCFTLQRSLATGYLGYAIKKHKPQPQLRDGYC